MYVSKFDGLKVLHFINFVFKIYKIASHFRQEKEIPSMETSPTLLDQLTTDLLVLWLCTAVLVIIFLVEVATKLVRVMENGVDQLQPAKQLVSLDSF